MSKVDKREASTIPINKKDLIYLAGFFDGEGCILIQSAKQSGYKNYRHKLTMTITTTSSHITRYLKALGFYIFNRKPYKTHCKQQWAAVLCDRRAKTLLEKLLPYLKIKKNEALLAIKFQNHKDKIGYHGATNGLGLKEINYRERVKKQLQELKHV
jgi:hypothetical protein